MKTLTKILAVFVITIGAFAAVSAQTSLPSLNGGSVDVQAQKGKVVILAVGASWLPLSGKQAEFTNALAKKYAGKNVTIYFVATDSTNPKSKNFATDDQIRQWASTNRLTVPILRDSDGTSVMRKFAVDQLPAFIVLDKSGNQSGDAFGGIDPKYDITVPIGKKVDSLL
ncbi:MAG TPA: TlpA disulfide reductase family protein [Pyrinomonadaceae bacterium]|jgi:thiol-disulfide isomerase/thioredoxin|nr:TlpA disulfide reductase family protein [Pyrinomonadaceae bacterium]